MINNKEKKQKWTQCNATVRNVGRKKWEYLIVIFLNWS